MHRVQITASIALGLLALTSWGCQASTASQTRAPIGQNASADPGVEYVCASNVGGATISVQKTPLGARVAFDAVGRDSAPLRQSVLGENGSLTTQPSDRHLVATSVLPVGTHLQVEETADGVAIVYAAPNASEAERMHGLVDADVARLDGGGCAKLQVMQETLRTRPRAAHHSESRRERGWDSSGSDMRGPSR